MKSWFQTEPVSERLIRIIGATGECMFLALGEERAMLVDTGTGLGDPKGLVESITQKPLTVVLTHGHVDHARGVSQFDSFYMNEKDLFLMDEKSGGLDPVEYIRSMAIPAGEPALAEVGIEDLQPVADLRNFLAMKDGDLFDLGGLTAVLLALPGHTPGSMAVLFPEEKTLLTGDACCGATLLSFPYSSFVEEYEKTVRAFDARVKGLFSTVLVSHGNRTFGPELIDTMLETCREILRGEDEAIPMQGLDGNPAMTAHAMDFVRGRHDGKSGNIVYSPDRIRKNR